MCWNEINTEIKLTEFLNRCGNFHDSCLKELRYTSGAFVDKNLNMSAINGERELYIIIQMQSDVMPVIEIRFSKLIKLNLKPVSPEYTCEILDSSMFFEDGKIYWGDSDDFYEQREQYDGTWICAKKVSWRTLDNCYMGEKEIYKSER